MRSVDFVHPLGLSELRALLMQSVREAVDREPWGLSVDDLTIAGVLPPVEVEGRVSRRFQCAGPSTQPHDQPGTGPCREAACGCGGRRAATGRPGRIRAAVARRIGARLCRSLCANRRTIPSRSQRRRANSRRGATRDNATSVDCRARIAAPPAGPANPDGSATGSGFVPGESGDRALQQAPDRNGLDPAFDPIGKLSGMSYNLVDQPPQYY